MEKLKVPLQMRLVRPSSRLAYAFLTFMASFLGFFEMHTKAALAARSPELLACD